MIKYIYSLPVILASIIACNSKEKVPSVVNTVPERDAIVISKMPEEQDKERVEKFYLNDESEMVDSTKVKLYKWLKALSDSHREGLLNQNYLIIANYCSSEMELNFEKQHLIYDNHSDLLIWFADHFGYHQGIATVMVACRLKQTKEKEQDYFTLELEELIK